MKYSGRFSLKAFIMLLNGTTFFLLSMILFSFQGCIAGHSKNTSPESAISHAIAEAQGDLIQGIITDSIIYSILVNETAGTLPENEQEEEKAVPEPKETRLKYPAFSVVFHNFKGYEVEEEENSQRKYYSQFGGNSDFNEAELNDGEKELDDYIEALVVKKDTLHISEQLFDDRINNTLIQILPKNITDRFKLSFCYLSNLGEIIDDRNMSREEADERYKKAARYSEQTKFYSIKDSANYYFRAMPHTPDMEEVTVKDGKVVPVKKPNTKVQVAWEKKQLQEELARIKRKYQLRDTLVIIPGEYDTVAMLTKNKKLFNYGYESFLFRLERFSNKKLIETKYIVVSIAYGC